METTLDVHKQTFSGRGTLILTRREVRGLLRIDECIEAVEEGFRKQAEAGTVPPGLLSANLPGGAFHLKTAGLSLDPSLSTPRRAYFAAKLNGNFHNNASRFGLPRIQGLVILCDSENGYPLAVIDSTEITVVRTGAATAVAAKYLARRDASTATICGCGLQGRIQLKALACVRPLNRAWAFDLDREVAERFCDETSKELGIPVGPVTSLRAGSRRSDLVVTCTPSVEPLLGLEDLADGCFVAAVGADSESKRELAPELPAKATLVVDHLQQCAEIGELHHAIKLGLMTRGDVHAQLHEVVAGLRPGRTRDDQIIVFDSTGVAHQDVAAGALVFEKAKATGAGCWVELLA